MSFFNVSAVGQSGYTNAVFGVGQMVHVCRSSSSVICTTSFALFFLPGLQEDVYKSADIFGVRHHPDSRAEFLYSCLANGISFGRWIIRIIDLHLFVWHFFPRSHGSVGCAG